MSIGQLEAGIDGTLQYLTDTEEKLVSFDDVKGDPKCIETYMKKLQVRFSNFFIYLMLTFISKVSEYGGETDVQATNIKSGIIMYILYAKFTIT